MFQTNQDKAAVRLQRNFALAADVAPAGEEDVEGDGGFEPRQGRTEAEVDTIAKGEMTVGRAMNIEGVGIGKLLLDAERFLFLNPKRRKKSNSGPWPIAALLSPPACCAKKDS